MLQLRQPQVRCTGGLERLSQQPGAWITQIGGELPLGGRLKRTGEAVHGGSDFRQPGGYRGDILPRTRLGSSCHTRDVSRLRWLAQMRDERAIVVERWRGNLRWWRGIFGRR